MRGTQASCLRRVWKTRHADENIEHESGESDECMLTHATMRVDASALALKLLYSLAP